MLYQTTMYPVGQLNLNKISGAVKFERVELPKYK